MTPDATVKGLVGMMVERNEGRRYLREALADLLAYCEKVFVLDDGSTDDTCALLEEVAKAHPGKFAFLSNPTSTFLQNESRLRRSLWEYVVEHLRPEWIICLDADELMEEQFKPGAGALLAEAQRVGAGRILFNLFEFWGDRQHYRTDGFWNPRGRYSEAIIRWQPGFPYRWLDRPLHCGRLPLSHPGTDLYAPYRLRHYGYANPADHRWKYERYLSADPDGRYCPLSHYRSILTPPVLAEWVD